MAEFTEDLVEEIAKFLHDQEQGQGAWDDYDTWQTDTDEVHEKFRQRVRLLLQGFGVKLRTTHCSNHRPIQNRDAKPPWCRTCGLTAEGFVPRAHFDVQANPPEVASTTTVNQFIDVVFDGAPDQPSPKFVEVEDFRGRSVRAGNWLQRADGYWVLRLTEADVRRIGYEMPTEKGWYLDNRGDPIFVDGEHYTRPGKLPLSYFHFTKVAPFTRLVPEVTDD